ncbi:MAG: tRNA-dihydrouridine synthase family protein, partial [Geopsychrobacter sp.]|nr:tRNA-dihydrouridine synthase family protein [Geopsychrobacter sp.]
MPFNIGSLRLENPLILAPMAGITSLPFRKTMKAFGASLVFTEMISANGLIRDGRKTLDLLASCPAEKPLGIQLFGDDPQILAEGARLVSEHADLLDINMGCPVKKVVRSGAGSALLKSPVQIGRIVEAVRAVFSGPLTIKIRAATEALMALGICSFFHTFLLLRHRMPILGYLSIVMIVAMAILVPYAFFQPYYAAGLARLSFGGGVIFGG